MNSVLIENGLSQTERAFKLNEMAIRQMAMLEHVGKNEILR